MRAAARRNSTLKQNQTTDSANPRTREEKGRSSDIAAKQVGFKSGRELERAITAVNAIDNAKKSGDTEKAEIIRGQLNNRSSYNGFNF